MKKNYIKPVTSAETMSPYEMICESITNGGGTTEAGVTEAGVKDFDNQQEFGNLW